MTQQDLTDYASDGGDPSTARYVPDTCIGFDVTADFAHFRKVGNNSAKPSYRVPPRTPTSPKPTSSDSTRSAGAR